MRITTSQIPFFFIRFNIFVILLVRLPAEKLFKIKFKINQNYFVQSSKFNVNCVDFCHDSATQASLMALAAPKVQCSKIKRWRPKAHLLTSRVKAAAAGATRALAECAGGYLTRLAVQDGDGLDGRRLRQGECCAIQRALAGGR